MIHLDANVLIAATHGRSDIQDMLRSRLEEGEGFAVSAIAWAEFLNGPLSDENRQDGSFIVERRILPVRRSEAEMAARIFNQAGRKRGSLPDCLIAATAILARMPLLTLNRKDFVASEPFGLRLV